MTCRRVQLHDLSPQSRHGSILLAPAWLGSLVYILSLAIVPQTSCRQRWGGLSSRLGHAHVVSLGVLAAWAACMSMSSCLHQASRRAPLDAHHASMPKLTCPEPDTPFAICARSLLDTALPFFARPAACCLLCALPLVPFLYEPLVVSPYPVRLCPACLCYKHTAMYRLIAIVAGIARVIGVSIARVAAIVYYIM